MLSHPDFCALPSLLTNCQNGMLCRGEPCLALPWSSLHCLGLPHNAWYCLLLPCMFHRAPFPLSQHPPPPSACFFTQTQFVSQDFLTDFSRTFAFTLLPLCNVFFSNILDQSIKLPPSWRFEAQSSFWKPVLPRVRFLAATFSGTTDTYLLTASFFWPPEGTLAREDIMQSGGAWTHSSPIL